MKKQLSFIFILFFSFTTYFASAQEVGIRFGDVVGNDVAIDAVFELGKFSRIHADVSFGNDFGIEALYDFLYRPVGAEENLHWYVGAGPSMLFSDPFFLGISGEVGIEYHFSGAPIAVGADWRPTFWLIEDTDFRAEGFGINARYVF